MMMMMMIKTMMMMMKPMMTMKTMLKMKPMLMMIRTAVYDDTICRPALRVTFTTQSTRKEESR